ncbi:DUF2336 domain-containing protein [Marinivivus vitaminiproducens]|uniref:DUF2336 domain-containing protein n=1 Tax=Marinivivus vitaminiproducens TaxID=3035935 RepID=UPI0027A9FE8D|nr:DUF2336 domain-containing protein [Geminicoccaceae bacterium SCSIO 64248]
MAAEHAMATEPWNSSIEGAPREVPAAVAAMPFAEAIEAMHRAADRLGLAGVRERRLPAAMVVGMAPDLPNRRPDGVPHDTGEGDTTAFLRARHARGELGPDAALAFLVMGDLSGCEAALAVRARLRPRRTRRLLHGLDPRAPAALAVAADLDDGHYLLLRAVLKLVREGAVATVPAQDPWLACLRAIHDRCLSVRRQPRLVAQFLRGPG